MMGTAAAGFCVLTSTCVVMNAGGSNGSISSFSISSRNADERYGSAFVGILLTNPVFLPSGLYRQLSGSDIAAATIVLEIAFPNIERKQS